MKRGGGGSFLEIQDTLQKTNPTFKCFGLFNYELSSFIKKKQNWNN